MTPIDTQARAYLSELDFFRGLDAADLDAFAVAARVRSCRKGEQLCRQGEKADKLFAVVGGWLRLSRRDETGEIVTPVFAQGDIFGEAAIFGNVWSPYTIEAAQRLRVIEIPGLVLEQRARGNLDILMRVMEAMTRNNTRHQLNTGRFPVAVAPRQGERARCAA